MGPDASYFVDRDEQRAFLWRLVELGAPGQLAVVQGPDGIGKSALLETLQDDCKAAGITSAKIELSRHEYRSDPNFLSAATDLWCSLGLGTLSELIALVTEVHASGGSDRAPGPASTGEPYETVRQEQRSSLPVPAPASPGEYGGRVRSIEGHVDHVAPGAQVAIGYNINQIQIIYGKTKNQDDARTMEPLIRRNVTMGFQRRLEESWQLRRTVILLDSWESALSAQDTLTEAGAWICDNVLQFIVDKAPANCLVFIASGRNPQLGALERVARRVELGPLPQVAVDEYFATVVKDGASPDALSATRSHFSRHPAGHEAAGRRCKCGWDDRSAG